MPNKFFSNLAEASGGKGGPVNMKAAKDIAFVEKDPTLPGLPGPGRPKKFSGTPRVKTHVVSKGTL